MQEYFGQFGHNFRIIYFDCCRTVLYYEDDMFDEEDAGTLFAGQSIVPDLNDGVSALQSVKGVEDGWTTETSRTGGTTSHDSGAEKTNVQLEYDSYLESDYQSGLVPSGYSRRQSDSQQSPDYEHI